MKSAPRYDIFQKVDGHIRWIETATILDDAKARVKQLATTSTGQYFIFDAVNVDFIWEPIASEQHPKRKYHPPAFRQIRIPQ